MASSGKPAAGWKRRRALREGLWNREKPTGRVLRLEALEDRRLLSVADWDDSALFGVPESGLDHSSPIGESSGSLQTSDVLAPGPIAWPPSALATYSGTMDPDTAPTGQATLDAADGERLFPGQRLAEDGKLMAAASTCEQRTTYVIVTYGYQADGNRNPKWVASLKEAIGRQFQSANIPVYLGQLKWDSQSAMQPQFNAWANKLQQEVLGRVSGKVDFVFVGHSRGAIFNNELITYLYERSGAQISKIGFVGQIMLDPTAAVNLGDRYPRSASSYAGSTIVYVDGESLAYHASLVRQRVQDEAALSGAYKNWRVSTLVSEYAKRHGENPRTDPIWPVTSHQFIHEWYRDSNQMKRDMALFIQKKAVNCPVYTSSGTGSGHVTMDDTQPRKGISRSLLSSENGVAAPQASTASDTYAPGSTVPLTVNYINLLGSPTGTLQGRHVLANSPDLASSRELKQTTFPGVVGNSSADWSDSVRLPDDLTAGTYYLGLRVTSTSGAVLWSNSVPVEVEIPLTRDLVPSMQQPAGGTQAGVGTTRAIAP